MIYRLILSIIFINGICLSKKVVKQPSLRQMSVEQFIKIFPNFTKIDCLEKFYFQYPQLPTEVTFGHSDFEFSDCLDDIFVLTVPQAKAVYDQNGLLWVNDVFILEIAPKVNLYKYVTYTPKVNIPLGKINGRVVAIYHPSRTMYGHYILDILGMIAVLEMNNIEYDYICLPYDQKFMKEIVQLWGIPEHKVIEWKRVFGFFADELIVPSNVSRDQKSVKHVNYYHPKILQYIRNKILTNISNLNVDMSSFSKKIFLSRKDAYFRNIPNEDEIFELFAQRGFKKYEASRLSVAEQILLFHNATHIVGATGSNMTNILFSNPGTHFLTFIQNWADRTFYILSLIFDLKYYALCDTTEQEIIYGKPDVIGRNFDIDTIQFFLEKNDIF